MSPAPARALQEKFHPYHLKFAPVPLSMLSYDGAEGERKSLSDSAKLLYGWLRLRYGRPKDESFLALYVKTIAEAMKVSEDTVGRRLRELEGHRFIKHKRRGPGRPWEITFLDHPCFSADAIEKRGPDTAKLRFQDETLTPQNCGPDTANCAARSRNSAALIPQNGGSPYREDNNLENTYENTRRQHRQVFTGDHDATDREKVDDAADGSDANENSCSEQESPTTLGSLIEAASAASGQRLSRDDRLYCAELSRKGIDAETVYAGVLTGRARNLSSDSRRDVSEPVRSLRYFDGCISEVAARGLPAGYVDHLQKWIARYERPHRAKAGVA